MDEPRPARRSHWFAALLPVCLAVWLYWPVVDGGLLSDDLLLRTYALDHDVGGGAIAWRHAVEDLQGPWLFGHPFFYRPLTTLTFVAEHWLFGSAAGVLHATNLGLFALSVFALGRLATLLAGPLAGLAAGTLLAVHPAANETICWACTRADLLIVATTLWACVALVRHRRQPGMFPIVSLLAACGLALLAKESALTIPPLLLVLDLALGGGNRDRRWRLHIALLPLWGIYLWWRTHLGVTPSLADLPPDIDWSLWPGLQCRRLQVLVAPHHENLPATLAWLLGTALAAVWFTGMRRSASRRWLVFGAAWLVITSLPTTWHMVFPNMINSRYVLLTWAGIALATGIAMRGLDAPRWWKYGLWLLLAVASIDMGRAVRMLQGGYQGQWRRVQALQEQLAAAAAATSPEAPVALLSTHIGQDPNVPFLDSERAYPLLLPPATATALPFVSLGSVLDPAAGPDLMQGDVTVWRMLWRHGARIVYWVGQEQGGRLVTVPAAGTTPAFAAGPHGFTAVGEPASPWPIAAFEVHANEPFQRGALTWHSSVGHTGSQTIGPSHPVGESHVATVDLTPDAVFLLFGTLHGISRLEIGLQSDAPTPPVAHSVIVPPMPAPTGLRTRLRGAPVGLAKLGTQLPWDSLPTDADPGSSAVVLMNRSFAWRLARPERTPCQQPRSVSVRQWQSDRIGGLDRVYYYLECRVGGQPRRTEIDWFVSARD